MLYEQPCIELNLLIDIYIYIYIKLCNSKDISSIYIDIIAKLAPQDLVIQKLFQLSDTIRCRYLQSTKKGKRKRKPSRPKRDRDSLIMPAKKHDDASPYNVKLSPLLSQDSSKPSA